MHIIRLLFALAFLSAAVISVSCSDHGVKPTPPDDILRSYTRVIRDFNYLDRTYFDLVRRDTLSENDLMPGDSITHIELWYVNVPASSWFSDAKYCSLFVDPSHKDAYASEVAAGVFIPFGWDLTMGSFYLEPTQHYVIMDKPFANKGAMGAYIRFKRPSEVQERIIGHFTPDTSYSTLKLIAASNSHPPYVTWKYMWHNVYALGEPITNLDSLIVDIRKGNAAFPRDVDTSMHANQDGMRYIHLLGLDNDNDGRIDIRNPQILDRERGHLRIPSSRTPFADAVLNEPVPELYNTSDFSDRIVASKYFLAVRILSK